MIAKQLHNKKERQGHLKWSWPFFFGYECFFILLFSPCQESRKTTVFMMSIFSTAAL